MSQSCQETPQIKNTFGAATKAKTVSKEPTNQESLRSSHQNQIVNDEADSLCPDPICPLSLPDKRQEQLDANDDQQPLRRTDYNHRAGELQDPHLQRGRTVPRGILQVLLLPVHPRGWGSQALLRGNLLPS